MTFHPNGPMALEQRCAMAEASNVYLVEENARLAAEVERLNAKVAVVTSIATAMETEVWRLRSRIAAEVGKEKL